MSKSQEFQKGYDRGVEGKGATTWTEDTITRPPQGEDKTARERGNEAGLAERGRQKAEEKSR
jgi:hypothetical protein